MGLGMYELGLVEYLNRHPQNPRDKLMYQFPKRCH